METEMEIERRLADSAIEVRFADGEAQSATTIKGYAARFNTLSSLISGRFVERIAPGAFDDVLGDDVRALINHDPNLVLGRTTAGTLRLSVDGQGLVYEVDLPDTAAGRDLATSIKRGDVTQSSFGFSIEPDGEVWSRGEGGTKVRTITRFKRLYDVSPVTYPAYADTSVALRSLQAIEDAERAAEAAAVALEAERRARWLQLARI
jgi:HK97 family phage prohead protease